MIAMFYCDKKEPQLQIQNKFGEDDLPIF